MSPEQPRPNRTPPAQTGQPGPTLQSLTLANQAADVVIHELAGLVDGSSRFIALAIDVLAKAANDPQAAAKAIALIGSAQDAVNGMADLLKPNGPHIDPNALPDRTLGRLSDLFGAQPMHQAIDAACRHTRALAVGKGVEIETEITPDALGAPPLILYPIMVNGLRNAIEASAPGEVVRICVGVTGDHDNPSLRIRIIDRGPISLAHDPAHLFQLGTSTKGPGRGIGLTIIADLIKSMHGTATLNRNSPGPGSVLELTIPFAQDPL